MKYEFYQPCAINELGKRSNQEDSIFPELGRATVQDRLFLVCDGMGGNDNGEVASSVVCNALGTFVSRNHSSSDFFTDKQFQEALDAAYNALDAADLAPAASDAPTADTADAKMGTTVSFLYFHRGGCLAAHIGDSRIYHFRPSTGEILYRSRDHSLVNQLYEYGEITREEMRQSSQKNILLRAVQPNQKSRTVADLIHITDIKPGDYFLMCTDGMLETLEDNELLEVFQNVENNDSQKQEVLRKLTEDNSDNHSAYIIHIKKVESEESDSLQPSDETEARAASRALNDTTSDVEVVVEDEAPAVEPDSAVAPVPEPAAAPVEAPVADEPVASRKSSGKLLTTILSVLLVALIAFGCYYFFALSNQSSPKRSTRPAREVPRHKPAKSAAPVRTATPKVASPAKPAASPKAVARPAAVSIRPAQPATRPASDEPRRPATATTVSKEREKEPVTVQTVTTITREELLHPETEGTVVQQE